MDLIRGVDHLLRNLIFRHRVSLLIPYSFSSRLCVFARDSLRLHIELRRHIIPFFSVAGGARGRTTARRPPWSPRPSSATSADTATAPPRARPPPCKKPARRGSASSRATDRPDATSG